MFVHRAGRRGRSPPTRRARPQLPAATPLCCLRKRATKAHWPATAMKPERLSWRVGLPFVLVVLAATVTLVAYLTNESAAEARTRLEHLAAADAAFLVQQGLPTSERMARDLQRVTGFEVYFRHRNGTTPELPPAHRAALEGIPADGRAHRRGDLECVAAPLAGDDALLLVRAAGRELHEPRVLVVLGSFWLLALLTAWLVGRGLVRPLQRLAAHLPAIDRPGPLALPEARRGDEIGDVARAFLAARSALHEERQQRLSAERLAALGRLTAAFAHEVQNPIAAIKMHAQLARGGPAEATAAIVEHEVGRIENLLNQWMFLCRPDPPRRHPVDLAELLAEVVAGHRAQLDHARVRAVLGGESPLPVSCDRRRLAQVFSNLLTNAVQAMPAGGGLAIDARSAGGHAEVAFTDGGPGFSAAALAHFAELFFSEKEGGMGIGLSVANEIVRAHGGSLRAENVPGGGARVVVALPGPTTAGTPP
ncbi:MAG: HAMP domain-containing protein [Planctomycetes bacterium]|nr:HAMP domain-containing protein [Planctomycetota bacterium]